MAESGAEVVRREVTGLGRTKRREAVILRFILQDEESRVLLHKTVPVVILNVRIATKSRDYKINTKLVKLI